MNSHVSSQFWLKRLLVLQEAFFIIDREEKNFLSSIRQLFLVVGTILRQTGKN
jgi:hypothetical protein